jgi:hypothetical protein
LLNDSGCPGTAADGRGLPDAEAAHLVDLPAVLGELVALRGRADDHREQRLVAAPVDAGLAHRDRVRALEAARAVAGFRGEEAEAAVGLPQDEVAAARHRRRAREVVAEDARRGGEAAHRDLGDEEDRVRRRDGMSRRTTLAHRSP